MRPQRKTGPLPLHEFRDEYLPSLGFKPLGRKFKGGGRLLDRDECSIRLVTNTETGVIELCVCPSIHYRRGQMLVRQRVHTDRITVVSPTWEDFYNILELLGITHLLDSPEPASTIPPV